jgi:hypothetical protein
VAVDTDGNVYVTSVDSTPVVPHGVGKLHLLGDVT